jgi:hypothetical protein
VRYDRARSMYRSDPGSPTGWADQGGGFLRLFRGVRVRVWREGAWWYSLNDQRCARPALSRADAMRRAMKAARKA